MKTLLVSLFMLSALSSQAGVIKNKKTGDTILIDLDAKTKTALIVTEVNGEQRADEILLKDYNFKKETLTFIFKDEAPLTNPFGAIEALVGSEAPDNMKVIFFIPALALDTILLPIALPASAINQDSYGKFKKDMNLIQSALNEGDYKKSVSNKQFKRIIRLINSIID